VERHTDPITTSVVQQHRLHAIVYDRPPTWQVPNERSVAEALGARRAEQLQKEKIDLDGDERIRGIVLGWCAIDWSRSCQYGVN